MTDPTSTKSRASRRRAAPGSGAPRLAERLLAASIPADQRAVVLGDLSEELGRRRQEGLRLPRLWYWGQALLFAVWFFFARAGERRAVRPDSSARAAAAASPARAGGAGSSARAGRGVSPARVPGSQDTRGSAHWQPQPPHRAGGTLDNWLRGLRFALRSIRQRPGFATVAVVTLALGIGANTAIFSVMYGELLRPFPYREIDGLVWLSSKYETWDMGGASLSVRNFFDLRAAAESFDEMAAYTGRVATLTIDDDARRLRVTEVTWPFLGTLGMAPAIGRDFGQEDDVPGAARAAIVSFELWRNDFGLDPEIIGRTIVLDEEPHTIVGVLPRDFYFPTRPSVLRPLRFDVERFSRQGRRIYGIGRLAAGVGYEAGVGELDALYRGLVEEYPEANSGWSLWPLSLRTWIVGSSQLSLTLLGAAVGAVLLIACVNVANLLLVRNEGRRQEMAVRFALGATRGSLLPHFLGEGVVLGLLGGIVGIFVARGGVTLLLSLYGSALRRADGITVDERSLGFSIGLSLATGIVVGLIPALRTNARDLYMTLRDAGGRMGPGRGRLAPTLVIAELALAVTLVAGAGLLINSFVRLQQVDLGLRDPEHVLTFEIAAPESRYPERTNVLQFFDSVLTEIEALPGVEHAGLTTRMPLNGGTNVNGVTELHEEAPVAEFVEMRVVSLGFFAAVGIPQLAGAPLGDLDIGAREDLVIINAELARQLFSERDPIGERIDPGYSDDGFEVVAVVGNVRDLGPRDAAPPAMYFPMSTASGSRGFLAFVRASGDVAQLAGPIREAVRRHDRNVPIFRVRPFGEVVAAALGGERLERSLGSIFALVALLLGAIGVYGVVASTVARRTWEIGVRLALGAAPGRVRRMVIAQALRLTVPGLLIGLAGAVVAGRAMSHLLYEVRPADPLTLAAVAGLLLSVGVFAGYWPARRAARVDPVISLRGD